MSTGRLSKCSTNDFVKLTTLLTYGPMRSKNLLVVGIVNSEREKEKKKVNVIIMYINLSKFVKPHVVFNNACC